MTLFLVWNDDHETCENDGVSIEADDAEEAALMWARAWDADDGEYPVAARGGHVDCWVVPADGSAVPVKIRVRGECEPTYWIDSAASEDGREP